MQKSIQKFIYLALASSWLILGCHTSSVPPPPTPTPAPTPTSSPAPTPSPTPTPPPTPTPTDGTQLNIGMNLGGPSYWDAQSMYADLTAYTSGWWADTNGIPAANVKPFSINADNYPVTDAQVLTYFVGYPTGNYQVSFDHNANTKVVIGWSEHFLNPPQGQVDSKPDLSGVIHTTFQLKLVAGSPLMFYARRVDFTKPDFLLKNFHILSPDASGSFRAPFLAKLAPFNPIRMMGMNNTNDARVAAGQPPDCPAKNWADRTVSSNFSRSTGIQKYGTAARDGATYEEEIELANTLHKDIWIIVPDCATDDFVTQLATLFHSQLKSSSKLYVEFSNETWNTGFGQWYNLRDFSKTVSAVSSIPQDVNRVQIYTAYRLMQIAQIFQKVYGADFARVIPVLAGQAANTWTITVGLDFLQSKFGDPKQWIKALSIAPYFGNYPANATYDAPSKQYFTDHQMFLKSKLPADQAKADADMAAAETGLVSSMTDYLTKYTLLWLDQAKAMQVKYGLPVVAYEGGQGLTSGWAALANQSVIEPDGTTKTGQTVYYLFDPMHAVEADPRMADLYAKLLNGWKSRFGSQPFVHLGFIATPNNFGFWGLWESLDQAHSVKGDEVLKLIGGLK